MIGEDDDQPSRAGTPRPKEKADVSDSNAKEKTEDGKAAATEEKVGSPPEISPEVQTRLRKLEKLEPKYSGE